MFICGSASFSQQDERDKSSPKRSKKTNINNKNPYSDRGLDKFHALLEDLENKKRSIYTQKGSDDISLVRFVYTDDSNNVKPIVVKKQDKSSSTSNINQDDAEEKPRKKRRCFRSKGRFELNKLRQPFFFIFMIVFFILLFLVMYGRCFAILCSTIVWYLIGGNSPSLPSLVLSNERKPKRKEYERKLSD